MAQGRRPSEPVRILGRSWEDVTRDLQDFLDTLSFSNNAGLPVHHGSTHSATASDPLIPPGSPSSILPDDAAAAGAGPAYAYENHTHGIATAIASGLANSNAKGSASAFSRADHTHKRDVRVSKASVDVGTRNRLNFIDGSGVTITVADNGGADQVDVTVATSPTTTDLLEQALFFASFVGR